MRYINDWLLSGAVRNMLRLTFKKQCMLVLEIFADC